MYPKSVTKFLSTLIRLGNYVRCLMSSLLEVRIFDGACQFQGTLHSRNNDEGSAVLSVWGNISNIFHVCQDSFSFFSFWFPASAISSYEIIFLFLFF